MATVVEGDPKAPFSIATTPMCCEGATPFPGLLHFTLDPYFIMLSVKQGSIKYQVFGITRPGIESRSPGPLANTNYYDNVWSLILQQKQLDITRIKTELMTNK